MEQKSAVIHTRVQPALKATVEKVLAKLGLSTSEAINLYFSQIALHKGLPFDVKIPNRATKQAIKEARSGKGMRVMSVEELMRNLNA